MTYKNTMRLIDEIRNTSKESKDNYKQLIQSFIDKIENYKKEHPYSDGVCLGSKFGDDEAKILREKGYCIGFQGNKAWCHWKKKLTPKEEEAERKYKEEQRLYLEKRLKEESEKQFNYIIKSIKKEAKNPQNNRCLIYRGELLDYTKAKLQKEGFRIHINTYIDGSDYCGWDKIYENIISW